MAHRRYHMSSSERAVTLMRELGHDDTFRASRPIGYAHVRVVDIEHPPGASPDRIVRGVDPLARVEFVHHDVPEPTT